MMMAGYGRKHRHPEDRVTGRSGRRREAGAGLTVESSFPWRGGGIRLAQDQVSELPQLPVRVGGAEAFFDIE